MLIIIELLVVFSCSMQASYCHACIQIDRDSLLSFNLTLSAAPPLNWSRWVDCCRWEGVGCDDYSGRVTTLSLPSRGLNGTISPHIVNLTALWQLNLSNNLLSDPLPYRFFDSLDRLQAVDLSSNQFSQGLSEIGRFLFSIRTLNLSNNNFHGMIGSLFPAPNLETLDISNNNLYGQIDEAIANLTNLKILALNENNLTGTIPPNIGRLSRLEHLWLQHNYLNGSIPQTLSNCTFLVSLQLRNNTLAGDLSTYDFSKFIHLTTIDLAINSFTGPLPKSLFSCNKLKFIRLSANNLSGTIPPDIVALQSLSFLRLSYNNLTNIQLSMRYIMRCKSLSTLTLSYNFYDEQVPTIASSAEGLHNLRVLCIDNCRLTGPFPLWVSKLVNLEVLCLENNRITGSVPAFIKDLTHLFYLSLSSNRLSGQFPLELTRLQAMTSQIHDHNVFEIPVLLVPYKFSYKFSYREVSSLPTALYLDNNNITGTIPAEIGRLKSVAHLFLNKNNFSGTIPDTISNLTDLEKLDLSENHLSGEIPESIRNLHFLSYFNVAYNNLEGRIPEGGQFDTFPRSSIEGNPGLCGRDRRQGSSCQGQEDNLYYEPRIGKGHGRHDEGMINWTCFEIGYVFSFIFSILVVFEFIRIW